MGFIDTVISSVKRELSESALRPTHYAIIHAVYKRRQSNDPNNPLYHSYSQKDKKTVEYKVPYKPANPKSSKWGGSLNNANKNTAFIKSHPDHQTLIDAGWHFSSHSQKDTVAIKQHNEEVKSVIAEIENNNVIVLPVKEKLEETKMSLSRPVGVVLSFIKKEEQVSEALGTMANIKKASKDAAERSADPRTKPGDAPAWLKQAIKDKAKKAVQKEELDLEEAVSVKTSTHSWGKMMTVHHGASHSFPLHPEHQEKIAKLKHGESVSFNDETNSRVTAHRDGDTIHLSKSGSNTKTPVAMSHFKEEKEMSQKSKDALMNYWNDLNREAGNVLRRDKVKKLLAAKKKVTKEESEIVNELSKDTLKSYVKKALDTNTSLNTNDDKSIINLASRSGREMGEVGRKLDHKAVVRSQGVQRAVNKLTKEEAELDEAKRGRPRKDGSKAGGDEEGGREHIIVQLRKAENLRGERHTEFNDSSKHKLPLEHVKKALNMHSGMKPIQKGEFEARLAKSHKSFHDAISGKPAEPAKPKVTLAKSVREDADPVTRASDRGAMTTFIKVGPNGRPMLVKKSGTRDEIKVEAVNQFAKQYTDTEEEKEEKKEGQSAPKGASADTTSGSGKKYEKDPLFSKVKLKLPPTVGNKASGGEDSTYGGGKYSVAEEKTLNSLYDKLDEDNKEIFKELIQTEEGVAKLMIFATEQGI